MDKNSGIWTTITDAVKPGLGSARTEHRRKRRGAQTRAEAQGHPGASQNGAEPRARVRCQPTLHEAIVHWGEVELLIAAALPTRGT